MSATSNHLVIDMDDASRTPPRNEHERQVSDLAAAIDFEKPASILEFGSAAAARADQFTDAMLSKARPADLDETGKQLTEIVLAAQQFDVDSLDNPWGRLPIIGSVLKSVMMSKERALARFETVKTQIDKLVGSVESTAKRLKSRDADYQLIYAAVRQEYETLGLHVEAISKRLEELRAELDSLEAQPADVFGAERINLLESAQKNLAKKSDDLKVLQHSMLQMMPMVRILQANNLAVIDKFATIRSLTLPTWKRTFLLALSMNEQKDAADLADTIDNATNEMLKRNAEMLKQNSIAIAKSNQRLVIDVATLKAVHSNVLETLNEVRQIHIDGASSRAAAIADLEHLRREMAQGVKSLSADR
jgi:uncharacterized protein YaaN involved in tellurite resistance